MMVQHNVGVSYNDIFAILMFNLWFRLSFYSRCSYSVHFHRTLFWFFSSSFLFWIKIFYLLQGMWDSGDSFFYGLRFYDRTRSISASYSDWQTHKIGFVLSFKFDSTTHNSCSAPFRLRQFDFCLNYR